MLGLPQARAVGPVRAGRRGPSRSRYAEARDDRGRARSAASPADRPRDRRGASSTSSGSTPSRAPASAAAPSARRWPRTPSPYVMLNFTDHMSDVADDGPRARPRHALHAGRRATRRRTRAYTGLALAEVPSTFAEFIAFDHLLADEAGPRHPPACWPPSAPRAHSRASSASRCWPATSSAPTRCERRATTLTPERLSEIWWRRTRATTATRVEPARTATGWAGPTSPTSSTRASTPTPTSSRSWSALVLYARYRERRRRLRRPLPRPARRRAAPATRPRCCGPLGVDLTAAEVWDAAFDELERMVAAAEAEI